MAVIIGSARGDERGRITGGQAGDQTGREVATETWYKASGGWRVLRAKDPAAAERIAWDMQAACDNNKIGYDQSENQTLWYEVRPLGFDCSKVTQPCETDCSQLVRVCVNYAGIPAGYFYTGDEAAVLLSTGAFIELTDKAYQNYSDRLRRGDILVTKKKGHTVVVLTDGPKAYVWGSDMTIAAQRFYKTPVDGEIWGQYTFNKRYLPNADDGWKWSLFAPKGSTLIKAMQKDLANAGFYKDDLDGIAGKNFVRGLQLFLNTMYPEDPLGVDGVMGAATCKRLGRFFGL